MESEDVVFKAVAHPIRREIIGLLTIAPRSVKDLTAEFEVSQPAISQHLKELKDADLVASERIGLEQRYRLTPRPLKHILSWSDAYRNLVDPSGHLWKFTSANNRDEKVRVKGEPRNGR
jgi:DNA-binding transcriptional ArsR family regulator